MFGMVFLSLWVESADEFADGLMEGLAGSSGSDEGSGSDVGDGSHCCLLASRGPSSPRWLAGSLRPPRRSLGSELDHDPVRAGPVLLDRGLAVPPGPAAIAGRDPLVARRALALETLEHVALLALAPLCAGVRGPRESRTPSRSGVTPRCSFRLPNRLLAAPCPCGFKGSRGTSGLSPWCVISTCRSVFGRPRLSRAEVCCFSAVLASSRLSGSHRPWLVLASRLPMEPQGFGSPHALVGCFPKRLLLPSRVPVSSLWSVLCSCPSNY